MRIAIFGNTNNIELALAMELRRLGHEVELVVNRRELLHRPESCCPEWRAGYPAWIHDASELGDERLFRTPQTCRDVLRLLERADAYIMNHIGPSLVEFLPVRPYIAHMTGSDLDYYATLRSLEIRTDGWSPAYRRSREGRSYRKQWAEAVERQRRGIAGALAVAYMPPGVIPEGDAILGDLGITGTRRFTLYFIGADWGPFPPPRARDRVVVFCGARVTWVRPGRPGRSALDFKGTDRLLRGFALLRRRLGTRVELRLVEKGDDVEASKRLARDLGVEDAVVWMPEMDRRAFREQVRNADIVVDHFDTSFIGMAGLEAMAAGRPLVAKSANTYWLETLGVAPPIFHAETPEQIAEQLRRLAEDARLREESGFSARAFVERYWSAERAARDCLVRLRGASVEPRAQQSGMTGGAGSDEVEAGAGP